MKEKNNSELEILGTHQTAVTDAFQTIKTSQPQRINPPETGPGVYDERSQNNENK